MAQELFKIETLNKFSQPCWYVSSLMWPNDIKEGIAGSTYSALVSDNLHKTVVNDIKHLLPMHNCLVIQHYVWDKNAGIALHCDENKKFGATIYMNQQWSINWGGLFVYKDQVFKTIIPEYNSMIINSNHLEHAVTPVSPYSPELRVTLQIWGY